MKGEGEYAYGSKDGKHCQYFENGMLRDSYEYDDDFLHGRYEIYRENGKLQEEGFYVND